MTQVPELYLEFCSAGDPRYQEIRALHYVVKKGNHGQQAHFIIWHKGEIAGIISGGGAVYACAPRDTFFKMTSENREKIINGIVDNTVFRLVNRSYNLGSQVLALWERAVSVIWKDLYGVDVFGFETFIVREGLMRERILSGFDKDNRPLREVITVPNLDAAPEHSVRRGNLYRASNWSYCGETAGSAKGHDGVGLTGGMTGRGGFLRKKTPKKDVYCKWARGHSTAVESEYISSWKANAKDKEGNPIGTAEEQTLWKSTAKVKSNKRKTYLGKRFYRRGDKVGVL